MSSRLKAAATGCCLDEGACSISIFDVSININPLDIHHVMSFASIYIGDSQTMAAEAGVLGTPFIRFNDFVG